MKPEDIRREYKGGSLDESQVAEEPVGQFAAWFFKATHSGLLEPTAMRDIAPSLARLVGLTLSKAEGLPLW